MDFLLIYIGWIFVTPWIVSANFNLDLVERIANYTGCKLLSVVTSTENELAILEMLKEKSWPRTEFWTDIIQTCPEANLTEALNEHGLNYSISIDDLQKVIDEEKLEYELSGRFDQNNGFDAFALDHYHNLKEIYDFLDIAAKKNPEKMSIAKVGATSHGRDIKIVKLGTKASSSKPAIWIDSGIHAREWVTVATSLYMIHQMLTSNATSIMSLLKIYDFYIVPVVNPDGYHYSWTSNRLWRKNLSRLNGTSCVGVDLNRNFDIAFKESGSSSSFPCSYQYKGPKAFSENETRVIKNYMMALKNHLKAFITLHSYGQMWLLPYGYKMTRPQNYNNLMMVAKLATTHILHSYGTQYRLGPVSELLYPASGSSVDWAYEAVGVKYSYGIELRDKGRFAFLLPRSEILGTAKETFEAISIVAHEIANKDLQEA